MQITAQMVSQLREQTNAPMMKCKKALEEAGGDMERARDILRAWGAADASARSHRTASEGVIAVAHSPHAVTLIELNSETDFVARNPDFQALAREIAQVAAHYPHDGVAGLMELKLEDGKTVRQKLDDALSTIRENLVLRRAVRYDRTPDNVLGEYVHTVTNKTGVLIELQGDPNNEMQQTLARNLAMHIAASRPQYIRREEVPADIVAHEREVLAEKTRNEGKPEAAIPKIVEGRLGKFYEQVCLLEQPYVREPSKRVRDLLEEAGAEVRRFALFVVGQE